MTEERTQEAQQRTLGSLIRWARNRGDYSLREFARLIGISAAYMSDIENDRRAPAEVVLRAIAGRLHLTPANLLILAGRFGEAAEAYLTRVPRARLLLIELAEADLPESFVIYLQEEVRREVESRRRSATRKETP